MTITLAMAVTLAMAFVMKITLVTTIKHGMIITIVFMMTTMLVTVITLAWQTGARHIVGRTGRFRKGSMPGYQPASLTSVCTICGAGIARASAAA